MADTQCTSRGYGPENDLAVLKSGMEIDVHLLLRVHVHVAFTGSCEDCMVNAHTRSLRPSCLPIHTHLRPSPSLSSIPPLPVIVIGPTLAIDLCRLHTRGEGAEACVYAPNAWSQSGLLRRAAPVCPVRMTLLSLWNCGSGSGSG